MPKEETKAEQVSGDDSVVTMVLLGQNSPQKCLIGNAMLEYDCFQPGKSMYQKALGRVRDELLYIINTPDFFWRSSQDAETNTIEEMKPSYSDPRMFLLVLQDKQLSEEEMEMFAQMREKFGEKLMESVIVVLMDQEESGQSYDTPDMNLKKILYECDDRICAFSKDMTSSDLVGQLLIQMTKTSEKQEADPDRLNEDMNKPVHQKEKEQPKTTAEERVKLQPLGGDGMITVVLLGMNSDDKCLIGNSILQHDCFTAGRVTCDRVVARVADQMVCIVNTPDLFFYNPRPDPIAYSMEEMQPSYAGPRVFFMVLQDKALSQDETEMFEELKERFGKKSLENMLIVLIGSKEKTCEDSETSEVDVNIKRILDEHKEVVYVFRSHVNRTELVEKIMRRKKKKEKQEQELN